MESKQQISIIAIHGNGRGGFRFEIAKPLFFSNINFLNPSLPGFNSTNNHSINLTMKRYAEWQKIKQYYHQGAGPFLANKVTGHKSLDHNKNIRHGS